MAKRSIHLNVLLLNKQVNFNIIYVSKNVNAMANYAYTDQTEDQLLKERIYSKVEFLSLESRALLEVLRPPRNRQDVTKGVTLCKNGGITLSCTHTL